ncbi:MAG: DoxX family protein [Chryseolinea sp.]
MMNRAKLKVVSFWILTSLLTFELIYGALWDFNVINRGYVYGVLEHLGYPLYLALILAYSKILAAVVIILPGLLLPKEWAYAGSIILFFAAFASHVIVGDTIAQSGFALGLGVIALSSWALRPGSRRILPLRNSLK